MKKLNNKGYLLVEIIVAVVLAFAIAYFLMNLTIKFSKKDEDIYQSITWTNDKNILTNMIMEDVEKYKLISITLSDSNILFRFNDINVGENGIKKLIINKDENKIIYGDYTKKIDKSLTVGDPKIDINNNDSYTSIKIPMTSIYSDEDYGIKLFFSDGIKYLYDIIASKSVLDNKKSTNVSGKNGIVFSNKSSSTNGQGVYLLSSSLYDDYPIYYYRGAVADNNVIFADFCWKIVRTTETGGIKLIYNGSPTDGTCNNSGGASIIGSNRFNSIQNDVYNPIFPSLVGYKTKFEKEDFEMVVQRQIDSNLTNIFFGSGVTYDNNKYTLVGIPDGIEEKRYGDIWKSLDNYHYTCFSNSKECDSVYYITYAEDETSINSSNNNGLVLVMIKLKNGTTIKEVLDKMLNTNNEDSDIKSVVDTWYEVNLKESEYSNYIEDTIWCNDRGISADYKGGANFGAWNPNGKGSDNSYIIFDTNYRIAASYGIYKPSVKCNNNEDIFTVESGKLVYPVGLLTADEVVLAGGRFHNIDDVINDFYLNIGQSFWTMSPSAFRRYTYVFALSNKGNIVNNYVSEKNGIRPSISLVRDVIIEKGDGSANNPYVIK